ncbi:MAG TPA: hypothetical protein PKL59_21365 [Nitrospira sp.]|nr:hypothetical protein [Nitrospira sp.]HNK51548.1 hypothetical protein [Nitrospira sp.]HNM20504.1 hypothetical protein [Nitrospira sp.]
MPTAVRETIQVLEMIVQAVPVGTNLGLLYMLWAMLSGSFLKSRGAVFPALQESGLDEQQMRRSWAAMRYGKWAIETLIEVFRRHVQAERKWEGHQYEGYRPVAVDWTAFWRPQLQGWEGKMYHGLAQRALPGVGFGVVVDVGQVGEQRVPLLRHVLRIEGEDLSESGLKQKTLEKVAGVLQKDEIAILDAGVKVSHCQAAGIPRFVVRLANNCTARRNVLPQSSRKGRPRAKGELIRPLARTRQGNTLAASTPDLQSSFTWQGRVIQVHAWKNLVLPDDKVDPERETFHIWVFFDPLYQDPLVLAANVDLQPLSVFALYLDRWPVEQVPLAAKQMIGLHRQFVFAPDSILRLPELALLAGNVLTYLAAVLPSIPTGFWDRYPRKTPGRLRRLLAQTDFLSFHEEHGQLRKKNALTFHLPKGIEGHRRRKRHP